MIDQGQLLYVKISLSKVFSPDIRKSEIIRRYCPSQVIEASRRRMNRFSFLSHLTIESTIGCTQRAMQSYYDFTAFC